MAWGYGYRYYHGYGMSTGRSRKTVPDGDPFKCSSCEESFDVPLAMVDFFDDNCTERICQYCDEEQYAQQICQSKAQTIFKVSPNDLDRAGITYEERRNPTGRSRAPMKLYTVLDLYNVAVAKAEEKEHKRAEQLQREQEQDEEKERKKAEQLKRKQDEADDKERNTRLKLDKGTRRQELKDALTTLGLKVRQDNALCDQYISGNWNKHLPDFKGKGTLQEVVDGVLEEHYLEVHTVYWELLELTEDDIRHNAGDDEEKLDEDLRDNRTEMKELALTRLEDAENAYAEDKKVKACKCGKKKLKQYVEATLHKRQISRTLSHTTLSDAHIVM